MLLLMIDCIDTPSLWIVFDCTFSTSIIWRQRIDTNSEQSWLWDGTGPKTIILDDLPRKRSYTCNLSELE